MSAGYQELLEATIQHLQELKARGVRFLPVSPETLQSLNERRVASRVTAAIAGPESPAAYGQAAPRITLPAAEPAPAGSPAIVPAALAPPLIASGAPLDPQHKAEAMRDLRERALACVKCPHLVKSRKNVVFGVGDINATLMFVGEAPGADEDSQGEPFVGVAGQLLTRIIQTMGLSREKVYIANILKCRPDTPGQSSGNRKPTGAEMETCSPYLLSQISLIQPRVMVALGGTAVDGLLGPSEGITRLRGHWQDFRGVPLMPTFHPSYLLRNQALTEKRKVWEDMLQVMEKLEMPISDKQRGFFLKA